MMINNLKELEQRGTLEIGDEIFFSKLCKCGEPTGITCRCTLNSDSEGMYLSAVNQFNGEIFSLLEIDGHTFCTEAYGYEPVGQGSFPYAREDDIEAINRVVRDLYKVLEKDEEPEVIEDAEETDRFSLIDMD